MKEVNGNEFIIAIKSMNNGGYNLRDKESEFFFRFP